MQLLTIENVGLSFGELLYLLVFLGTVVGSYLDLRIRIKKIEVETTVAKENFQEHKKSNEDDFKEYALDTKEALKELSINLNNLQKSINDLKIELVKKNKE